VSWELDVDGDGGDDLVNDVARRSGQIGQATAPIDVSVDGDAMADETVAGVEREIFQFGGFGPPVDAAGTKC